MAAMKRKKQDVKEETTQTALTKSVKKKYFSITGEIQVKLSSIRISGDPENKSQDVAVYGDTAFGSSTITIILDDPRNADSSVHKILTADETRLVAAMLGLVSINEK